MSPPRTEEDWASLEVQADRLEVQEILREAIRRGEIRVAPRPDGGIRIIRHVGPLNGQAST